jgi:GNAT superfamily N-acetyltransferase
LAGLFDGLFLHEVVVFQRLKFRAWYASKFPEWDWGLIAEDKGTAVGFVAAIGPHLDQLFVDPEYQGRGIGTHLLKATLDRMPAIVTLNVFEQCACARVL